MTKITPEQRKELERLGYTVDGNYVKNSVGTVASFNEKGGLFSGSKQVSSILSGSWKSPQQKPPMKTAPKSKAKAPQTAKQTQPMKPKVMDVAPKQPKSVDPIQTLKVSRKNDQQPLVKQATKPAFVQPKRPITKTPAKTRLAQKYEQVTKTVPKGLNFTDWKRLYAGKQWKPGEALQAYKKYKND